MINSLLITRSCYPWCLFFRHCCSYCLQGIPHWSWRYFLRCACVRWRHLLDQRLIVVSKHEASRSHQPSALQLVDFGRLCRHHFRIESRQLLLWFRGDQRMGIFTLILILSYSPQDPITGFGGPNFPVMLKQVLCFYFLFLILLTISSQPCNKSTDLECKK